MNSTAIQTDPDKPSATANMRNPQYTSYRSLGKIHRWIFSCENCSW